MAKYTVGELWRVLVHVARRRVDLGGEALYRKVRVGGEEAIFWSHQFRGGWPIEITVPRLTIGAPARPGEEEQHHAQRASYGLAVLSG